MIKYSDKLLRMKLILGSASKWRQQILREAGYNFSTLSPDIDEKKIRDSNPSRLVLSIAHAKADALLPQISEPAILITSDQVVFCHNEIFEKPSSEMDVRNFLNSYQQHSAATVTAIVVTNTITKKREEGVDIVNVEFNPIPENVINHMIAEGEIFNCAGGFQIEDEHAELNPYIKKIDGSIDSVKGLPIALLKQLLEKLQYEKN